MNLASKLLIVLVLCSARASPGAQKVEGHKYADVTDALSVVELAGLWLFRSGDNLAFAEPTFDDSDWEQRQIPTKSTPWRFRWQGYGWYRLHLRVDERAVGNDWMVAVGRAREVVELYVNGSLIATRGRFGSRLAGGERTAVMTGFVPSSILKRGDNVIAVRVYDPSWGGGLVSGPLLLGPPSAIYQRLGNTYLDWSMLHLVLALLALFVGVSQLNSVSGRWASRESFWLAGAGVGLAVAHLGGTGVLTSLLPSLDLAVRTPLLGATFAIFCVAGYFATRFDNLDASHVFFGKVAFLVLTAALLLVPDSAAYWMAAPAVLVFSLVVALYAAYLVAQAASRQEPMMLPVFGSVIVLTLLLVYDGLTADDALVLPPASLMGAVGVLIVASITGMRHMLAQNERVLVRLQNLEQLIDAEQPIGLLDTTAMSVTDPDRFFDAVLHEAARELSVRRCSLVLPRDGALAIVASVGLPKHTTGMLVPVAGSIAGWVYSNAAAVTENSMPEELLKMPRAGQYATNSFVSQPVLSHQRCVGVLNISDRLDGGDLSPADERAVAEVASKLALVLEKVCGAH